MISSRMKVRDTSYSIPVVVKRRKDGSEVIEKENFRMISPVGYKMSWLKRYIRSKIMSLLSSDKKEVEFELHRYPQVDTVIGQIKAEFPTKKFSSGWTNKEEDNTLYSISLS